MESRVNLWVNVYSMGFNGQQQYDSTLTHIVPTTIHPLTRSTFFCLKSLKNRLVHGRNFASVKTFSFNIVLRSSNFKLPLGDAAILPICQQKGPSHCVVTNFKGSRPCLDLVIIGYHNTNNGQSANLGK